MILCVENPKDSSKKLLHVINKFGEVAGYKISIQKSVAFSCANNEITEREIKKTIPFNIARRKKNKVPRNKFNHEGKRPVLGKLQDIEGRTSSHM